MAYFHSRLAGPRAANCERIWTECFVFEEEALFQISQFVQSSVWSTGPTQLQLNQSGKKRERKFDSSKIDSWEMVRKFRFSFRWVVGYFRSVSPADGMCGVTSKYDKQEVSDVDRMSSRTTTNGGQVRRRVQQRPRLKKSSARGLKMNLEDRFVFFFFVCDSFFFSNVFISAMFFFPSPLI